MRRIILTVVALFCCMCLCGALGVVLAIDVARPQPRKVAVNLGDDWAIVRAASTYRFPASVSDSGHAVQQPVDFVYSDPSLGFDLAYVKTVWFTMRDGKVEWIYVLVSQDAEDWDHARATILDVGRRIDAAGWSPERTNNPDRARAYYDGEFATMGTYAIGLWSSAGRYAELQVYRLSAGPENGKPKEAPERFSVSLRIGSKIVY